MLKMLPALFSTEYSLERRTFKVDVEDVKDVPLISKE